MAKRLPGKAWLTFKLHGLEWSARIVPRNSKTLDSGDTAACVLYEPRIMYFADTLSDEQLATGLAHEIQHVFEEHADVDYEVATTEDVADRMSDQVARSWLMLIRDCPDVLAVFNRKPA